MPDWHAVREKSRSEAEDLGLHIADALPLLSDDDVRYLRSVGEVLKRSRALYAVLAVLEGDELERNQEFLDREALWPWASQSELAFLELVAVGPTSEAAEAERVQLTWRTEGSYVLGWWLGLIPELGPRGNAADVARWLAPISPAVPAAQLDLGLLQPRRRDEVAEKLDLFYCLHWAERESRLRGSQWPDALERGVVIERRQALEWLVAEDDWDDVEMST